MGGFGKSRRGTGEHSHSVSFASDALPFCNLSNMRELPGRSNSPFDAARVNECVHAACHETANYLCAARRGPRLGFGGVRSRALASVMARRAWWHQLKEPDHLLQRR